MAVASLRSNAHVRLGNYTYLNHDWSAAYQHYVNIKYNNIKFIENFFLNLEHRNEELKYTNVNKYEQGNKI